MRRPRMKIMTPANAKKGLGISKRDSWESGNKTARSCRTMAPMEVPTGWLRIPARELI
ncbi:MAG: hypothetical protein QXN69_05350 [Candidatus Methanomethylicaceae archaeon]